MIRIKENLMATIPGAPRPDTIEPQSPPESPERPMPNEDPVTQPDEIDPAGPDVIEPSAPDEIPIDS
jgi:hypothetical protein